MSVTWARSAATVRGITWDRVRVRSLRVRAILAAGALAGTAGGAALQSAAAANAPLPDLASVEQVVGVQQAWQAGATGKGVDVAVIDTGVSPVPGLDNGKVLYGPDLSFDSQSSSLAYVDNFGHGTAMAGLIAGNDGQAGGFRGVAPDSRVVSVKVGAKDGATDVSQIIAGIDWVVQHAHDPGVNIRVLNLSLGTDSTQYYGVDPLAQAAENAWRHGIAVVVAVGNDGSSSNVVADPASDPYLIAVGAEDPVGTVASSDDVVPSYSSRGTGSRHADLVAPGSYVMSLLASPTCFLATKYPNAIFNNRFFRGSGTSQAAAITSGVVADMLSAHPGWTPDMVKSALTSTATRISTNNPNFVGAGLLNAPGAVSATPSTSPQTWATSNGSGSLEQARGTQHVSIGADTLTGERDIFGNAWQPAVMVPAEQNASAWNGGVYNSATWSGSSWASATWSSATWSSATWSSATWSSATWSSATWSSATWSSATWSSATWSSATWSSATWSSATWSSATWSSATWSSSSWG